MPAADATDVTRVFLLLDIDGTLVMTDHLYVLAFQDLMKPHVEKWNGE